MRLLLLAAGLLATVHMTSAQNLPYRPTDLFVSSNGTRAYVFQPFSSTQATFSSIELTSGFDVQTIDYAVLTNPVPFLNADTALSYTPVLDANDDITVVSGNCAVQAAHIWRFQPDVKSSSGKGTWSLQSNSRAVSGLTAMHGGVQYLANGFVFDVSTADSDNDIYIFGGMCPFSNATDANWIDLATYSNLLMKLAPGSGGKTGSSYDISVVSTKGPPIAQAGASLTSLPLINSDSTAGSTAPNQQNFLFIGGHTQTAFINTSQLAIFSLPQQSWSFVDVEQPSNPKSGLFARSQATQVSPRTGHTAILSQDASQVIVFGGWVGDTETPAQPQLAILNVGASYGGTSGWSWSIPDQTGSNLLTGAGVFGHGAALLPGNIVMITGGYEISGSASKLARRSGPTSSTKTYLYNITSSTWISSYHTPTLRNNGSGKKGNAQEIGLGVGLGVGGALILSVIAFYLCYSRRYQQTQKGRTRDHTLLAMSEDGASINHMDQTGYNDVGFDGRGGGNGRLIEKHWPTGAFGNDSQRSPEMQQNVSLFLNQPNPIRGPRRGPTPIRGYQYHQAPRFDDITLSRGGTINSIHTIKETVEEEDETSSNHLHDLHDGLSGAEAKLTEVQRMLKTDGPLNPFADPPPGPLSSHPFSPAFSVASPPLGSSWPSRMSVPARKPVRGSADINDPNWIVVEEDDGPNDKDEGRISPCKTDDRTSSTLSDRSFLSTHSFTRTMSTRTGALLAAIAAANRSATARPSSSGSQSEGRSHTMSSSTTSGRGSPFPFATQSQHRSTVISQNRHSYTGAEPGAYTTARNSFAKLQGEGEALLGGTSFTDHDDPYRRALAAHGVSATAGGVPTSNYGSVSQPMAGRRRQGWVGSLRKALGAVSAAASDRSFSLTSSKEKYTDEPNTTASSPTKERPALIDVGSPRRTVSDGGALLRSKRGRHDWEANPDGDGEPRLEAIRRGDWGEPRSSLDRRQAEEDWDVEGAASRRDVQILFTVPKTRLRVVNDDMDRASLRSASDSGAISRAGSLKNDIRHEASMRGLRARAEGERAAGLMLPSTAEADELGEKDELLKKEKAA